MWIIPSEEFSRVLRSSRHSFRISIEKTTQKIHTLTSSPPHKKWFHSEIQSIQVPFIFLTIFIHENQKCFPFESAFNFHFFLLRMKASTLFILRMLFPPVAFHTYYGRIHSALVSTSHQSREKNENEIVPKRLLTVTDALWWCSLM